MVTAESAFSLTFILVPRIQYLVLEDLLRFIFYFFHSSFCFLYWLAMMRKQDENRMHLCFCLSKTFPYI